MTDAAAGLAALGVPFAVLILAALAAAFSAVLDARAAGAPLRAAGIAPVAEAARLLRQDRRTLAGADPLLWRIGGAGFLVVAVLQVIVIPIGSVVPADLSVGVVWFNAMDALLWAFWWLLGWGANSAWSLVGGYRFLGQALAYELPLMLAVLGPAIVAGSLRMSDVVAAQQSLWNIVLMPVAFLVFVASVVAFASWTPFATAAAGDAAGGVLAELSGPDRLVVLAGRYALLVSGAAVAVPLFLGGGAGPLLPAAVWVVVKTAILTAAFVLVGRLLPAIRPERANEVAWMVVLPLVLVQLLIVAALAALGRG